MSNNYPDREGLEALVRGIVRQAAYDWRQAMAILKREPDCGTAEVQRIECERFFLSDYFHALTGLDGTAILNRLREEFNHVR